MLDTTQQPHKVAGLMKEAQQMLTHKDAQIHALTNENSALKAREQEWAQASAHMQKEAQCKEIAQQLYDTGHLTTIEEYHAKVAELMQDDETTLTVKKEAAKYVATGDGLVGAVDTNPGASNPYGGVDPANPYGGAAPEPYGGDALNKHAEKQAMYDPDLATVEGKPTDAYDRFFQSWYGQN